MAIAPTEETLTASRKTLPCTTQFVALSATVVALEKVNALETRNAYLVLFVEKTIVISKHFLYMPIVAGLLQVG